MHQNHRGARFDETGRLLLVHDLAIRDEAVLREACRWTTGVRAEMVDDEAALADADVTAFATEAMTLGARALAATAQTVEARALERMVADVGTQTTTATTAAAELTARAAKSATDSMAKATGEARDAIIAADRTTREELTAAVSTAKTQLLDETRRLFAGERPELLERLQPVLASFGTQLEKQVSDGARQLLEQAAKHLDPADPTSPMARHAAALTEQHQQLATRLEAQNTELGRKVDDLVTHLKVQDARIRLAQVTPIKGTSFETRLHALMDEIAAGLGDEYTDTTRTVGALPRSKKGDGLLTVPEQQVKVVLEMSDSPRGSWTEYLDEAERNRCASAALGIVRSAEQNGGQSLRVLGPRRIVMAFDPETDDHELLRTVMLLLRAAAITAAARAGGADAEIATANERITAAIEQLERLNDVKKSVGTIAKQVTSIESSCTQVATGIRRLLDDALAALAGAGSNATPDSPSSRHVA